AVREARMKTALPQEKLRLASEIRAIYEQDMARPDLAFAAAAEAFGVTVEREQLRPDLERLARETNNFQKLAQVYEKAASALIPGDAAIPVLLRRAAELREHLGQTEDAIRIWRELLVQAPQDRQALDSLGKLYQQSKNAKNLSEIFA